ncbi:MAG: DUF2474 family protein [Alphaproteobacteria bacterium]
MTQARLRRLLWFFALWAAGVLTVGAVAYLLRAIVGFVYGPAA